MTTNIIWSLCCTQLIQRITYILAPSIYYRSIGEFNHLLRFIFTLHAPIGFTINKKSFCFTKFSNYNFIIQYQAFLYLFQCISHGVVNVVAEFQNVDIFENVLTNLYCHNAHAYRIERVKTTSTYLFTCILQFDWKGYFDFRRGFLVI